MNDQDLKLELESLSNCLRDSLRKTDLEKDALSHVMNDIVRIFNGEELVHHDEPHSLRQVLNEMASDYEVDHPAVAAAIRQILDFLSRIGI